jgi:carboxypeptidase C (cathepsin A)
VFVVLFFCVLISSAGISTVAQYLSQASVLQSLHVAPNITKWESCNSEVYTKIATPDWFNQEEYTIPVLLDAYRVMIYAGVNDWICNHQGNYKWVSDMNWNGKGEVKYFFPFLNLIFICVCWL